MSAYAKRQPRYSPVRGRRAEFAMVELRRREYLGEATPATRDDPHTRYPARAARLGAAAMLLSTALTLVVSVGLAASPEPEDLAIARQHRMQSRPHPMQSRPLPMQSRPLPMQSRPLPMQSRPLEAGHLRIGIPRTAADVFSSLAFATRAEIDASGMRAGSQPPSRASQTINVAARDQRRASTGPARAAQPQEGGTASVARAVRSNARWSP